MPEALSDKLEPLFRDVRDPNALIIIGMGNPDRADDGAGILIAESLKPDWPDHYFSERERPAESHLIRLTGERHIRAVIFIDAVHFGGEPGMIRLFDETAMRSVRPVVNTHQAPFSLLLQLLRPGNPEIRLLGIQPRSTQLMDPVSRDVQSAVKQMTGLMRSLMKLLPMQNGVHP